MSYASLLKQIETLQAQAERARRDEVAGVVGRIKEAITAYGLTAADLFSDRLAMASRKPPVKSAQRKIYSDGNGGVWHGMGKRPKWLAEALASGRSLDEFLSPHASASKPSGVDVVKSASGSSGKQADKKRRTPATNMPMERAIAGRAWEESRAG